MPKFSAQFNIKIYTKITVFKLFFLFFQHRSGPRDGGHLIRMIGWGEDNGVPYWLAANSWGNSYGENGLVRIIRGVDNVGVETRFSAASSYDESRSSYY